jgi:hypothetical protein
MNLDLEAVQREYICDHHVIKVTLVAAKKKTLRLQIQKLKKMPIPEPIIIPASRV